MNNLVRTIIDNRVAVAESPIKAIHNDASTLYPVEKAVIQSAVPKRRHEFIAGRILARKAMCLLGWTPEAIPPGEGRAPCWPKGLVGSISHTDTWCAVALAHDNEIKSIGIDVEVATPLERDLIPVVCTLKELASFRELSPLQQGRACKIIFSAKEAFYKAQFPLSGRFLDFHAVDIFLDWERNLWNARLNVSLGNELDGRESFEGRWNFINDHFSTSIIL